MTRLGKLVTAGIGVIASTSLLTGATTAYILRPTTPAESLPAASVQAPVRRMAAAAPRVVPAVSRSTATAPRPVPVAATTTASQCDTGADRALRIAKPGAIGALLGAGLGAAGGAIADGGSGAGKGALIGGLVGTVAGAGYGAYKTNNECGTIFGAPSTSTRAPMTETTLRPQADDNLTIFSVR